MIELNNSIRTTVKKDNVNVNGWHFMKYERRKKSFRQQLFGHVRFIRRS